MIELIRYVHEILLSLEQIEAQYPLVFWIGLGLTTFMITTLATTIPEQTNAIVFTMALFVAVTLGTGIAYGSTVVASATLVVTVTMVTLVLVFIGKIQMWFSDRKFDRDFERVNRKT